MLLATAAPAGPAFAQATATDIESARQLYNQGIKLRDAGDLKGALEKLKAAHALGNTPITGLELCKTHAALRQPVEAREVCLGVGRSSRVAAETSRSQEARDEAVRIAEEQRPKIATIRVHITGVPPGRAPTVTVDGAAVPIAALNQPRAVDPGRHDLIAKVGKGAESRSSFDLDAGESKDVTLPVQAPPPEEEPPPYPQVPARPPHRSNGLQTAGLVVAGVGVGVGLIAGGVALSKKGELNDNCLNKQCGTEEHDALDSAKTAGNVSTAFFILGGVGALVAIYATLSPPKAPSAAAPATPAQKSAFILPDFSPAGVGFHGAF